MCKTRILNSPLAVVIRDKRINHIFEAIRIAVRSHQPISIEAKEIDYIRRRFYIGIRSGEFLLHKFARLLCSHFAPHSVIQRKLVSKAVCFQEKHSDIARAEFAFISEHMDFFVYSNPMHVQLYLPTCGFCGRKILNPNFCFEYALNPIAKFGLIAFRARIKHTTNIAYKIADLVFDLHKMFDRDKIYTELSQVITDLYGIKALVQEDSQVPSIVKLFQQLPDLHILEEKNYLGDKKKRSGFEAYKFVVQKNDQLFEIQVQSRAMLEKEKLDRAASHLTYKKKLMEDRRKLGKEYVQLYEGLLKLLSMPSYNLCEISPLDLGHSIKGLDDEF